MAFGDEQNPAVMPTLPPANAAQPLPTKLNEHPDAARAPPVSETETPDVEKSGKDGVMARLKRDSEKVATELGLMATNVGQKSAAATQQAAARTKAAFEPRADEQTLPEQQQRPAAVPDDAGAKEKLSAGMKSAGDKTSHFGARCAEGVQKFAHGMEQAIAPQTAPKKPREGEATTAPPAGLQQQQQRQPLTQHEPLAHNTTAFEARCEEGVQKFTDDVVQAIAPQSAPTKPGEGEATTAPSAGLQKQPLTHDERPVGVPRGPLL